MFKMGSHDPSGYLKHKIWPKEGPIVKLPNWFLTTKNQESPQFPCVQVVCHISLKSYRQELKHWFRLHLNWKSTHKVMGLQSCKSFNFGNFGTLIWESRDKMTFGVGPMAKHKEYYKGEGGGFPQVWAVVSIVSTCFTQNIKLTFNFIKKKTHIQ